MITEEVFKGLSGEESVTCNIGENEIFPENDALVATMDRIRDVCSAGLSLREAHNLRTRLPLQSLTIAGPNNDSLKPYAAIVKDELNVKEVLFANDSTKFASLSLQVNAKTLGPKLGGEVQRGNQSSKS